MIRACKSLITATVVLLLFELAQSGQCPPCYRDQAVLQGHGPVSGSDNRRRLIIANDVPGAVNGKVTEGINGAAQKWNNARDTTSNPPNSYTTPYHFESGSYEEADFKVVAVPSTGDPARINLEVYPHEIRIRSDVLTNLSAADLAAMIAHEVGHRIGLANWNEEPNCPGVGATIMNGSNPLNGYRMHTTEVKSMDVFQVNRAFDDSTNMTHCQVDAPTTAGLTLCTDSDGDGFCLGNDCDDSSYDPNNTCSGGDPPPGGGGSSCPATECNEGSGSQIDYCLYSSGCPSGWINTGQCCQPWNITPIVIDVDGSGFSLTDARHGVAFDFFGIQKAFQLSWTAQNSTNAFLVLDRDGNGTIDSGRELFGNMTPQRRSSDANGFLALAEFDKSTNGGNGDRVIDHGDTIYELLRLWRDSNHNGVSEADELHSLAELGVATLELDYKLSKKTDEHGNQFRYRAKIKDSKGEQAGRWAWDVIFVSP